MEEGNCAHCVYWSELVARAIQENNHETEAMCLNSKSKNYSKYCFKNNGCREYMGDRKIIGSVDSNLRK